LIIPVVPRWVVGFSRLIDSRVRQRKKPVSGSWRMDETYIRLNGKWVYLYRAVDTYGDMVDFLLRAKRDGNAAKAFFKKAFKTHGRPYTVNIDKSGSNICALKHYNKDLDEKDQHEIRRIKYLNNIAEQDHRFIKKRAKPMMGFKNFHAAKETISGIENIRMIQKGQITGHNKQIYRFHNFANLMA
jgi:transposase-like protein